MFCINFDPLRVAGQKARGIEINVVFSMRALWRCIRALEPYIDKHEGLCVKKIHEWTALMEVRYEIRTLTY